MNVNKVILVGRLTRDPEMRTTPGGQTVTRIGLATGRTWIDKSGQKQTKTEFHSIVLWGKIAETAGQYLVKGQEAFFEGRIETRSYTDKSGVERKQTDVIAETMQFGSKPQGSSSGPRPMSAQSTPSSPAPATSKSSMDEIPTINLDDESDEIRIEDVPF